MKLAQLQGFTEIVAFVNQDTKMLAGGFAA